MEVSSVNQITVNEQCPSATFGCRFPERGHAHRMKRVPKL